MSEFERAERTKSLRRTQGNDRDNIQLPANAVKTAAEPRPSAYIPDEGVGIPKPYGAHAPFKPSEVGSTIRHIRVPQIKQIEI